MANTNSFLFCELSREDVTRVIKSVYADCEIVAYALCHGGLFNTTYKVTFLTCGKEQTVILRIGPVHQELLMGYEHDMMKTEAQVFAMMQAHGIPCSHVIAVNTERNLIERDFMMVEYIESVSLSGADIPSEDRYRIEAESGRLIRRMHEIVCDGFGRATDVLYKTSYPNYFASIFAEVSDLCEKSLQCVFFTQDECDRILSSVKKHERLLKATDKPRLCHGDMWGGNLLIQKRDGVWSLAAIIDVDRAYFGDVDFDLGNPWILSDAFLAGYGITREELETRERKIKREIAALVYFLIEAYVWYAQYNVLQNAENGKKAALEKSEWLLNA